jgi:wyosine [tRNA(Phe)-imidazoG37] synthetase (radical SAM superfamily)
VLFFLFKYVKFAGNFFSMATFLFDKIIFGPVKSRRLGISLGINLLPSDSKWCSFNCIYCECGWTSGGPYNIEGYPPRVIIREELEKKLILMRDDYGLPDTITFAGNGEPTLHPDFGGIISDTLDLRNRFAPEASVAVLSNGTMLDNPDVFKALEMVDQSILKIDSAREETMRLLNQPGEGFNFQRLVSNISRFNGKFVLQTLFVKGTFKGVELDNTSREELHLWLGLVKLLHPRQVMVYTIARDTPLLGLKKISEAKLHEIAQSVKSMGIEVQVSG